MKKIIFRYSSIIISIIFALCVFGISPKQVSAGTQIKTVEFFLYQFSTTSTDDDIASGNGIKDTTWSANCGDSGDASATINIPESSVTVRHAYVEWRTVVENPALSSGTMKFCRSGQSTTTATLGSIATDSGESLPLVLRLDVTSQILSGNNTYYFNAEATGYARSGDNAKLIVTYEYDDTSSTQLKTVRYMVGSRFTAATASTTDEFTVNPNITDPSVSIKDHWVEYNLQTVGASTTDYQVYSIMNSTNGSSVQLDQVNATGFGYYVLNQFATSNINLTSNNTIGIRNEGQDASGKNAEWVITYTYSYYTDSATFTNTARFFGTQYSAAEIPLTKTSLGTATVCIPETSPSYKSVFIKIHNQQHNGGTATWYYTISPGGEQSQLATASATTWGGGEKYTLLDITSYFNSNFTPTCEDVSVSGMQDLANNDIGNVHWEVIATYDYNASSTTTSQKTVNWLDGQDYIQNAAGTAFTGTFNTYIPESSGLVYRDAATVHYNHVVYNFSGTNTIQTIDSTEVTGDNTLTHTNANDGEATLNIVALDSTQLNPSPFASQSSISYSFSSNRIHTGGGWSYTTYQLTVPAAAAPSGPTKVVFTNSARTITAGVCNGSGNVLTIQLQNASSTPTNPTGTTVIRVSSNSPSETIYSDDACTTVVTDGDFTFTTSQNTKSVYIIDQRKSNPTWTLTASKQSGPDTIADGTQTITINAGSVTRLVITLPTQTFTDGTGNSGSVSNQTAGSSFVITKISATDSYFNVNTGYSGGKTLAYSGPANAPDTTPPSYTTSVSFTSGQSTTTLTTILYKAETTTITVTDGGSYGYASSSLTVNAGGINNYLVTASTPQIAATCFTGTNTITARDQWLNTRTTDASVVNMTTSGTSITFYSSAGCSGSTTQYTMSSGVATMYIKTPKKQSGITVTATRDGGSETGVSGSITVNPGVASAILVKLPGQSFIDGTGISGSSNFTGLRSPNATSGVSYTVDLKAVDANNNLVDSGVNNYTGSKTFDYSNSVAGNAPDSTPPSFPSTSVTFTNGEANSLSVTYYNAATGRTFQADDTGTPVNGTASTTFIVQANAENNYSVTASTPQTAGVAFDVTITVRDSKNNNLGSLYSAPAGTYVWTTTANNAPDTTAPSMGTLIQGDFTNGAATKSVIFYKAESGATITASEPSPSTVTGTSSSITTNPGNISADINDSLVAAVSPVNKLGYSAITITLKDTWRNPKSGIPTGDIVISGNPSEVSAETLTPSDASGIATGQINWSAEGGKTVMITIQNSTLVQNDGVTPDADGKLDATATVTVVENTKAIIKGGSVIRGRTTID